MLRHKSVFHLVESINADSARSECLGVSHLDDIGLHTAITKELLVLIRVARGFVKNAEKPPPFNEPAFRTSARWFLGDLRSRNLNHCREFVGMCGVYGHAYVLFVHANHSLIGDVFSYMRLHSSDARDNEETQKAWSEGRQCQIIQKVQNFP